MIKLVSWNLNSIKPRMHILQELISKESPDIILLQEIKCLTDNFPLMELESYNYNIAIFGQKTFNGVAIMSKGSIEDVVRGIPGFADEQARYIECVTTVNGCTLRVASVYVPNGQEVGSDKFYYKLSFLKALRGHLAELYKLEEVCLLGGDYNVAPEPIDVYDDNALGGCIGCHPDERSLMREIMSAGYLDVYRAKHPTAQEFSWWDYRGNGYRNNHGMRIDQILASPEAIDRIHDAGILKEYRSMERTSDHAPVVCTLV